MLLTGYSTRGKNRFEEEDEELMDKECREDNEQTIMELLFFDFECPPGVEKIFDFLGPQSNIENFLQVLKSIYTWIHPLCDTNKLLN